MTLSLLPFLSLILFSAASIAETYRLTITSPLFHNVLADFSLLSVPVTFSI